MSSKLLNKRLYTILLLFIFVGTLSSVCAATWNKIDNNTVIIGKDGMDDDYTYGISFFDTGDELIGSSSGEKKSADVKIDIPPATNYFRISLSDWKKKSIFIDRKFTIGEIYDNGIAGITFALKGEFPWNDVEYKRYGQYNSETLYNN
jgi:hypothetical protein